MTRPGLSALAASLVVLTGCGQDGERDHDEDGEGSGCSLGVEVVVSEVSGALHDVVLVARQGHSLAAWSAGEGTFIRMFDAEGAPIGGERRVNDRCAGGVAVATADDGFWLACSRHPIVEANKPGGVALLHLTPAGRVDRRCAFGRVGENSFGVAVAATAAGPVVAFADERGAEARLWLTSATDGEACTGRPRPISREGVSAGPPSMLSDGDRTLVAWSETVTDDNGTVGEVRVFWGRGAAATAAHVLHPDARPVLARDERGLVVAFRDERPAGQRPRIFAQRLSDTLSTTGEPVRIGRANGEGGLAITACGGRLFTVAPRTYDEDGLIGINVLDAELAKIVDEQQMYRAGGDYAYPAGVCHGGVVHVLAAELGAGSAAVASGPESATTRLVSTSLHCR